MLAGSGFSYVCVVTTLALLASVPVTANSHNISNVSLTFVVDVSGAMVHDLLGVRTTAVSLLSAAAANPMYTQFNLVRFRNDALLPTVTTSNQEEMAAILSNLTASGNGNCAKNTLTAIKEGLDVSADRSNLLVFTHSPPKDMDMLLEVKNKIYTSRSYVSFLLTDMCLANQAVDNATEQVYMDPLFNYRIPIVNEESAYYDIATSSGGYLYNAGGFRQRLRTIVEGTKELLVQPRDLAGTVYFNHYGTTGVPLFQTYPSMSELTVSLVGADRQLMAKGIDGEFYDLNQDVLTSIPGAYIVKIPQPGSGVWQFIYSSTSQHCLQIVATCKKDFSAEDTSAYDPCMVFYH